MCVNSNKYFEKEFVYCCLVFVRIGFGFQVDWWRNLIDLSFLFFSIVIFIILKQKNVTYYLFLNHTLLSHIVQKLN